MYAIILSLDTEILKKLYSSDCWQNAYNDVKKTLQSFGFDHQQGNVYFGNEEISSAICVSSSKTLANLPLV